MGAPQLLLLFLIGCDAPECADTGLSPRNLKFLLVTHMDRRSFLKFLSAAPLAAPMVAASAAASIPAYSAGVLGVSGVKTLSLNWGSTRLDDILASLRRGNLSQFDYDSAMFARSYRQTEQVADQIVRASQLPIHNVVERVVERALDLIPGVPSETADPVALVNPATSSHASEGA